VAGQARKVLADSQAEGWIVCKNSAPRAIAALDEVLKEK
jgi:hypothetical protein